MGTKNDPGPYDCYAALEDDEPFFVLKSTDIFSEYFVAAWAALRTGDLIQAQSLMDAASVAYDKDLQRRKKPPLHSDSPKYIEAQLCAKSMREWRLGKQLDKLEKRLGDGS